MSSITSRFEEMLSACGVSCSSVAVFTAIAQSAAADAGDRVDPGECVRGILEESFVAREYLGFPAANGPDDAPAQSPASSKGQDALVELGTVLQEVRRIAAGFGHELVTEMHFLLALITLQPKQAEAAIAPFAERHDQVVRLKTRYSPRALEVIPDRDTAEGEKEQARTSTASFGIDQLKRKINTYLSSEFYPYDEEQWKRACAEFPDQSPEGIAALSRQGHDPRRIMAFTRARSAFACHLGPEQMEAVAKSMRPTKRRARNGAAAQQTQQ